MDLKKAFEIVNKTYSDKNNGNTRILNMEGPAPFLQVKGFLDLRGIKHGFTTRLGGVSTGIYESMNMGLHLEDDVNLVMENYKRIGESMGIDPMRISCPNQVHKDNILVVKEEDAGDGIARELTHFEIDAQITNVKDVPLIVYAADCVPILLADPVSRVVGSVHAGWRGTVSGIAAKTVNKMCEEFGCLPENIHAVIGPSIGPDNYEVDETVINEVFACSFIDASEDNLTVTQGRGKDFSVSVHVSDPLGPGAAYEIFRTVKFRNRYMLNLWNLNELILVNAGLKSGNIYNTRLCTMKYHDLFFSHRYTNGKRGLNAGIISL